MEGIPSTTIVTVHNDFKTAAGQIKIEPGLTESAGHNISNAKQYTITSHVVNTAENTSRVANFKIVNSATHNATPVPQYQVPKYVVQMRNGIGNSDTSKPEGPNPPKFFVVQSGNKDNRIFDPAKPEVTGIEIINMPGRIQWNGTSMIVGNPINTIVTSSPVVSTVPVPLLQTTVKTEAPVTSTTNNVNVPVSFTLNSTKNRRKTNPMTGVTCSEPEPIIQQRIIFSPTTPNIKSEEITIDVDQNSLTKATQPYSYATNVDDSARKRKYEAAFTPVQKVEQGLLQPAFISIPERKPMKNIEFADKLKEIQAKMITGAIQLQELLEKQKEENVVSHALFLLELKGVLEPHLGLLETALEAIMKVAPKVDYIEIGPQDNRYFVKKENWHKAATKETLKDAAVALFECDLFIPKKEKLSSTVGRRSTFVVNGLSLQPLNPSKLNAIFNVLASNRLPNVKRLEADVVSNPGFLSQNEQKIVKEALAQYLNQFRQREKKLLQTKKEEFDPSQIPDVKPMIAGFDERRRVSSSYVKPEVPELNAQFFDVRQMTSMPSAL